jgi:hypothetical protein
MKLLSRETTSTTSARQGLRQWVLCIIGETPVHHTHPGEMASEFELNHTNVSGLDFRVRQ